jgi:hypothetical protein
MLMGDILDCGHILQPPENPYSTGYGYDERGRKICYACCGERDREEMMRSGRITLYLSKFSDEEWKAAQIMCGGNLGTRDRYKLSNWPGTFVLRPYAVSQTKGIGWYGCTYPIETFNFVGPDGYEWYGKCMGDNEVAHCRRYKKQSLSWRRWVWTCKDGRDMKLEEMEPEHIENCIKKINRLAHAGNTWRADYLVPLQNALDYKRTWHEPERQHHSVTP